MNKIIIHVTGMTCTNCERRLISVISTLDGVQSVEANYVKGEVYVEFFFSLYRRIYY